MNCAHIVCITIMTGFKLLLEVFSVIHGPQEECVKALRNGHLLGISPGGVREALFSDETYPLLWGKRKGFAQVAIDSKVVSDSLLFCSFHTNHFYCTKSLVLVPIASYTHVYSKLEGGISLSWNIKWVTDKKLNFHTVVNILWKSSVLNSSPNSFRVLPLGVWEVSPTDSTHLWRISSQISHLLGWPHSIRPQTQCSWVGWKGRTPQVLFL